MTAHLLRRWSWCAWCQRGQRRWTHPRRPSTVRCRFCKRHYLWTPNSTAPWSARVTTDAVYPLPPSLRGHRVDPTRWR